jgi:hypothetical protein
MASSPLHPDSHPTTRLVGTSSALASLRAHIQRLARFDILGSAHVPTVLLRLLPTSMRETRFSLAYSHPYDMNLMTGRHV